MKEGRKPRISQKKAALQKKRRPEKNEHRSQRKGPASEPTRPVKKTTGAKPPSKKKKPTAKGKRPEPQRKKPSSGKQRQRRQPTKKPRRLLFKILSIAFSALLLLAVVAVFAVSLFMSRGKIVGDEMAPTFAKGDTIFFLDSGEIQRFSVITFTNPGAGSGMLIERVIGLPGETIAYQNGELYVNGKSVAESFYAAEEATDDTTVENFIIEDIAAVTESLAESEEEITTVPEDMYLVLADNRQDIADSRSFGFIDKDSIQGVALFGYTPEKKFSWLKED